MLPLEPEHVTAGGGAFYFLRNPLVPARIPPAATIIFCHGLSGTGESVKVLVRHICSSSNALVVIPRARTFPSLRTSDLLMAPRVLGRRLLAPATGHDHILKRLLAERPTLYFDPICEWRAHKVDILATKPNAESAGKILAHAIGAAIEKYCANKGFNTLAQQPALMMGYSFGGLPLVFMHHHATFPVRDGVLSVNSAAHPVMFEKFSGPFHAFVSQHDEIWAHVAGLTAADTLRALENYPHALTHITDTADHQILEAPRASQVAAKAIQLAGLEHSLVDLTQWRNPAADIAAPAETPKAAGAGWLPSIPRPSIPYFLGKPTTPS